MSVKMSPFHFCNWFSFDVVSYSAYAHLGVCVDVVCVSQPCVYTVLAFGLTRRPWWRRTANKFPLFSFLNESIPMPVFLEVCDYDNRVCLCVPPSARNYYCFERQRGNTKWFLLWNWRKRSLWVINTVPELWELGNLRSNLGWLKNCADI